MHRALAVFVLLAASAALFSASGATAATPNNQACLGADFSTYARYGTPEGSDLELEPGWGFGQFNAWLAQAVPGLGLPIQFHLAGIISDSYVVNSCNDP